MLHLLKVHHNSFRAKKKWSFEAAELHESKLEKASFRFWTFCTPFPLAWRWGLRSWHVVSRMVNLNGVQSSHSFLKLLWNHLSLNGRRVNFEICVGGFKEVSGGQLRHWRGANWQRRDKLCNLIVTQSNKGEGTNWSWKDWNYFYINVTFHLFFFYT